jgi:hypothetical protein
VTWGMTFSVKAWTFGVTDLSKYAVLINIIFVKKKKNRTIMTILNVSIS